MKSRENNKGFGLLFFIVFLLIGLWPLIKGESPRILFFPIALVFLILGLMNAKILSPLNRLWIKQLNCLIHLYLFFYFEHGGD